MKKYLISGFGLFLAAIVALIFYPASPSAAGDFSGQTLTIAGTGDCQSLLHVLARKFEKAYKGVQIKVPESIGSAGGIKALADGKIDLARVARPLKPREQAADVVYHLFAKNPVVFVVNPKDTGVGNLSYQQIIDIYTGKINRWEQLEAGQGKIYVLTREPGDSSLRVLNKQIPGFKSIAKTVAKVFYSTPEAVAALIKHKNTIGFIPMAEAKKTILQIVKINGFFPSAENVNAAKYKLVSPFALVSKGKPTKLAKAFIDYVYSEDGRAMIADFGTIPSR